MLNWIEKEKDEYFKNEAALARLLTVTINYFIFKPPWQESVHHHHLFYNKLVSLALILS